MSSAVPADGRSDFDFIFGRWRVRNRKLTDVTDPACKEWVESDATAAAEPILGGLGHVDRIWADSFEGFTLRQFDPEAKVWRIWAGVLLRRWGHLAHQLDHGPHPDQIEPTQHGPRPGISSCLQALA